MSSRTAEKDVMQNVDILEQMNTYYAKRASMHDTLMGYTSQDATERLLAPIIRRFEKHVIGKNVLEVACGTGNWTQVLSRRARSVLATDINASVIEIAKQKSHETCNVAFRIADAFELRSLEGKYDAAFAADWWSHIPRSKLAGFLKGLHKKLRPGAPVVFVDGMACDSQHRMFSHYDDEGNLIHRRRLPSGEQYYVVKNFPTEAELRETLGDMAESIEYHAHLAMRRWILAYTPRSAKSSAPRHVKKRRPLKKPVRS